MKSLTSFQAEQLSDLQEKLQSASERVESAITDFNTSMSELWNDSVLESLNDYNTVVEQAREFVEERHDQMQSQYEDRSEKWQQSEKGEAFQEWLNEWEEAQSELEDIDLAMPVEVDTPDFSAVDAMDELSMEPSL